MAARGDVGTWRSFVFLSSCGALYFGGRAGKNKEGLQNLECIVELLRWVYPSNAVVFWRGHLRSKKLLVSLQNMFLFHIIFYSY